MFSLRLLVLFVLSTGCLILTIMLLRTTYHRTGFAFVNPPDSDDTTAVTDLQAQNTIEAGKLLGIASRVYVLSLPTRYDRRKDMEFLSKNLSGVNWTYVNAVDMVDPVVRGIMCTVNRVRKNLRFNPPTSVGSDSNVSNVRFAWPEDPLTTYEKLEQWAPGFHPLDILHPKNASLSFPVPEPMVCATQNITIAPYTPTLPHHRILTPARVACWHSHASLIRMIANDDTLGEQEAVVVLEDDIDAERDIATRLKGVWKLLPEEWDIVYLGHCWSNETFSPALKGIKAASLAIYTTMPIEAPTSPTTRVKTRLHPSNRPLCTHAYALSRTGARRILVHLRYPPFAYSRSIDKALAWLIQSGRVKSFSVVPSVVIQRKALGSDVMPGKGSTWKDVLENGVFG